MYCVLATVSAKFYSIARCKNSSNFKPNAVRSQRSCTPSWRDKVTRTNAVRQNALLAMSLTTLVPQMAFYNFHCTAKICSGAWCGALQRSRNPCFWGNTSRTFVAYYTWLVTLTKWRAACVNCMLFCVKRPNIGIAAEIFLIILALINY